MEEIKEKGQAKTNPGDNMNIQEVERLIAEIAIESTAIALDTNTLRKNIVTISEEIGMWAKRAGMKYGDEKETRWWEIPQDYQDSSEVYTGRLVVKKSPGGIWGLHFEMSTAHDKNPFSVEAFASELARTGTFERANRFVLEAAGVHIVEFLRDYWEELKRRHIQYVDLCDKMEKIEGIFSLHVEEET